VAYLASMVDRRRAKQILKEVKKIAKAIDVLEARPAAFAAAAQSDVAAARRAAAKVQMATIPVARLRETAKGLRLDAVEQAGYRTVADILATGKTALVRRPGIGEATARQVIAAARQVVAASESTARVDFDLAARTPEQTRLLAHLRPYELAQRAVDRARPMVEWFRSRSIGRRRAAAPAARLWIVRLFVGKAAKERAEHAVDALEQLLAEPNVRDFRNWLDEAANEIERRRSADEIWADYEANAAQLLGVLGEVTGTGDGAASRGHLPAEIVERVQDAALDRRLLKVGLRGYQAFGAKFALTQVRTILGDEMGLGKTVEALGVLCHLSAQGETSALVVCPASVVANWRAEITRHTHLTPHVIHGSGRDRAYEAWRREAGVAITTYDGLHRLEPLAPAPPGSPANRLAEPPMADGPATDGRDDTLADADEPAESDPRPLAMLVVDEAHYVKNPDTKRSRSVARWARHAERVLFLTGTPMENRLEEFQALVAHLQPDVGARVDGRTVVAGPAAFQTAVAPVYIRRNQSDVLNELPDLISSLGWVDPTAADLDSYRRAVASDNFMAMRRAAFLSVGSNGPRSARDIERSAKLARLIDIVEEASEEGLKVIVFSYFRDVLAIVRQACELVLPGAVYGPLTGSTAPDERQRLIEALGDHSGGAVLVAQIEAGGVGLNIQSASVVVLCEPQWKPTTEAHAIARSHRMGQIRRVQVHRLLLEDTVDQRMLAVLAGKQQLIERFVNGSAIKDATPDAVDISDLDQVGRVINEAQAETLILTSERLRLGLNQPSPPEPADAPPR
jgi:SNF2 family DNA or RNA helicase